MVAVSLVVSVYWLGRDPRGAFYLLPSRAWELGAGSLLVLARPASNSALRGLMAWLGLGGDFLCLFLL